MSKQAEYLKKRGFTREEYLSYLYQLKCDEARALRAALKKFVATVQAIPTPREVAIKKRKSK